MTTETRRAECPGKERFARLLETLLIFAVFFCHGGWPTPDNNEAHYVSKARHFWDPQWIPADPFLNSADSHVVFYALIGWLPTVVSMAAAAWIGRVATWLLLAYSWQRLSVAIAPRWGFAIVSAMLFLFLSEHFTMAGEWVVGGFEAKGFAYALVFLAIEQAIRCRWNGALYAASVATAIHVIVGGWTLVAFVVAWLWMGRSRPGLGEISLGIIAVAVGAGIGLYPALSLSLSSPAEIASEANRIYVFERLSHHLWVFKFNRMGVARLSLLTVFTFAILAAQPASEATKRLGSVIAGSVLISIAGLALSAAFQNDPERAASIARFYWYRLSDAFVPAGAALLVCAYADRALKDRPPLGRATALILTLIGLGTCLWCMDTNVGAPYARTERPGRIANVKAWIAVCDYIRENLPRDAVVLTPRGNQSFHWRAERAEVASIKNVPQEATAIVDWWRRIQDVYGTGLAPPEGQWHSSLSDRLPEEINAIAARYGAGYLLTENEPSLPFERLYENDAYTVYRIK